MLTLAKDHLGKALFLFDELHDARETAVCHFHLADLGLVELTTDRHGSTPTEVRLGLHVPRVQFAVASTYATNARNIYFNVDPRKSLTEICTTEVRVGRDGGLVDIADGGSAEGARRTRVTHTAALRAARKAAEFFTPPAYARDFVATHLKVTRG